MSQDVKAHVYLKGGQVISFQCENLEIEYQRGKITKFNAEDVYGQAIMYINMNQIIAVTQTIP